MYEDDNKAVQIYTQMTEKKFFIGFHLLLLLLQNADVISSTNIL